VTGDQRATLAWVIFFALMATVGWAGVATADSWRVAAAYLLLLGAVAIGFVGWLRWSP
jgi:hypothetical protein